ncbi:Tn3 family transposase [Nocardia sp. CDC160]|nr:Tn3 family transposase [Nocardia sp. CDC160]MEC3919216.1 Tn3 family transposase [Nocardia sp. CDC160]
MAGDHQPRITATARIRESVVYSPSLAPAASGRQNTLATALKEYGALRRTVYAAHYLSDPDDRRKISRQLNKGESLHALCRDPLYAHELAQLGPTGYRPLRVRDTLF